MLLIINLFIFIKNLRYLFFHILNISIFQIYDAQLI